MKIQNIVVLSSNHESGFIDISFDSRWLCDWYVSLLRKYTKSCNAKLIHIACTSDLSVPESVLSRGVLSASIGFDPHHYQSLSLGQRKTFLAQTMHECLLRSSRLLGIPRSFIDECARTIQEQGMLRSWCGPKVPSLDKKLTARMEYVHDVHAFVACLRIDDNDGRVIQRIAIGVEMPDAIIYRRLIGNIKWYRNGAITVMGQRGKLFSTSPSEAD